MGKLRLSIVLVAVALAGAATAQQECYPNMPGNPSAGETCHPTGQAAIDALQPRTTTAPHQSLVEPAGPYPSMCAGAPIANYGCYAKLNAERKEVGSLMANGQCDAAFRRALREADYKMADTVKRLCAAPAR